MSWGLPLRLKSERPRWREESEDLPSAINNDKNSHATPASTTNVRPAKLGHSRFRGSVVSWSRIIPSFGTNAFQSTWLSCMWPHRVHAWACGTRDISLIRPNSLMRALTKAAALGPLVSVKIVLSPVREWVR